MTDPHGDIFNRAIQTSLAPGNGRLSEAGRMRGRGARGQSAIDPREANIRIEMGQRGVSLRAALAEQHAEQKTKAKGGRGRADPDLVPVDEDEFEAEVVPPRELDPDDEDDRILLEVLAENEEHENEPESSEPLPQFALPEPQRGADPYAALEGSLGYLDDAQLGQLAAAVESDPSLSAPRRFALSEKIGRTWAARH